MELLDKVKQAGIVGAGGAGFPTHAKLNANAEFILMNGAECEPLLRVDQQLMEIYPKEIIKGFEMAGRHVGAKKGIIGVKGKHVEVIEILNAEIKNLGLSDYIEVGVLKDVYPAGDEQVLVYELTGRVVPEAGIPIQVGCVVVNSETALNIYRANEGQSVVDTYVTLAGDIPNRETFKVPVGTPIKDVLALSGITDFTDYKVIGGGPMMGPVLDNLDGYITKKDKGFIILKADHPLIRKKSVTMEQARRVNRAACEQCRMCTDMCPRYLLGHATQPHKMMRAMSYETPELEDKMIAHLCCQCNLCNLFSCPAGLYPKDSNNYYREKLLAAGMRYKTNQTKFYPRSARNMRLLPSKRLIARLGLKEFDKSAPMVECPLTPNEVHISTRQHVGAPAVPCVNVGDRVELGQKIGDIKEGALGATIHASIAGVVIEVNADYVAVRRG